MARPKGTLKIESPKQMLELFNKYKANVKANPFKVTDWVGGIGKKVVREKEKPLTLEGFYCFGYENEVTLKHYFLNTGGAYENFCAICSHIKEIIRKDQIEGGMAGMYNPSITQRLNNLVEKTQTEIVEQPLFPS